MQYVCTHWTIQNSTITRGNILLYKKTWSLKAQKLKALLFGTLKYYDFPTQTTPSTVPVSYVLTIPGLYKKRKLHY